MSVLLEYIIVFVAVLIINLFISKINRNNLPKGGMLPEVIYLKKVYKISIGKNDIGRLSKVVVFVNSFIITTIYIILMYLLDSWIFRIVVGIVLLILMIIICYGILGRYYRKKEGN